MVISGLHVSLVAGFVLLLGRGAARLMTPGRWRLAVWPWWLAAFGASGYALLAGLEPPALRALTMTLVGLWVASGRHAPGPWQGWWLALALVLLLDPLSAWRPGLWLSFGAVAMLILMWQGRPRPRGPRLAMGAGAYPAAVGSGDGRCRAAGLRSAGPGGHRWSIWSPCRWWAACWCRWDCWAGC